MVKHNENQAAVQDITVLTNWPGKVGEKVPSEYSFEPSSDGSLQWGFSIDANTHKMVWTKLQFDQHSRTQELRWVLASLKSMSKLKNYNKSEGPLPAYPAFEPLKVATEYLTAVRKHVISEMTKQYNKTVLDSFHTEIVVSIPAVSHFFQRLAW